METQLQLNISCSHSVFPSNHCLTPGRPLHGGAGRTDQPLDPRQLVLGWGGLRSLPPPGRVLHRRLLKGAKQARRGGGGQRRLYAQARAVTMWTAVTLQSAGCFPLQLLLLLLLVTAEANGFPDECDDVPSLKCHLLSFRLDNVHYLLKRERAIKC